MAKEPQVSLVERSSPPSTSKSFGGNPNVFVKHEASLYSKCYFFPPSFSFLLLNHKIKSSEECRSSHVVLLLLRSPGQVLVVFLESFWSVLYSWEGSPFQDFSIFYLTLIVLLFAEALANICFRVKYNTNNIVIHD